MAIQSVTMNGSPVHFMRDPQVPDMPLVVVRLGAGDVIVVTLEDGSRRHYRVNDHQRLPPHVRLGPHVTHFRTDDPPPPPIPIDDVEPAPAAKDGPPVERVSVWERLRKPLLS